MSRATIAWLGLPPTWYAWIYARLEQRLVVQHLLEMGDEPLGVGRVAMKAAPELVVDTAASHRVQRLLHHLEGRLLARPAPVVQQQRQHGRLGELGGRPEPAVDGIEVAGQCLERLVEARPPTAFVRVRHGGAGPSASVSDCAEVSRSARFVRQACAMPASTWRKLGRPNPARGGK